MSVPTHQEARAIIFPAREEALFRAFTFAWADWENLPERSRFSRWARTRAGMVFERLADRLQEFLGGDPGIKFHFEDETVKIVFDDQIVARCKKGNALEVGENIPTQTNDDFTEASADIPGLGGLKKIEIVYLLNRLQTAIERVVIHARDGKMRLWVWTIGRGSPGAEIVPFDLPLPPAPPQVSDAKQVAEEIVMPRKKDVPDEFSETE